MSLTLVNHTSPLPSQELSHLCEANVTTLPHLITHACHALPSVGVLIALAINETDFLGDLDHATLAANAANSADLAAELWEEARGYPVNLTVPLERIAEARQALLERGYQILCLREIDAADELADARDAGWA